MSAVDKAGTPLPKATLDSIRRTGLALKGPLTTPVGGGYRSVNVALRQELDLYANVRPVKTIVPGGRYEQVDLVIIRENTEGLYVGLDHTFKVGNDPKREHRNEGGDLRGGARLGARHRGEGDRQSLGPDARRGDDARPRGRPRSRDAAAARAGDHDCEGRGSDQGLGRQCYDRRIRPRRGPARLVTRAPGAGSQPGGSCREPCALRAPGCSSGGPRAAGRGRRSGPVLGSGCISR